MLLRFLLIVCLHLNAAKRKPYRFYLDPLQAEQLLASIVLKQRLTDQQWIDLLTSKLKKGRGLASESVLSQTYRIRPKDTLWSIAKSSLGSPWYWPKLWAINPEITNPHEIEVGRVLAYYRAEERPEIPLVRLVPNGPTKASSLDHDTFVNIELRNHYRPTLLIMVDDDPVFGKIRGSYTEGSVLYVHENVYIEPNPQVPIKPGARYAVVRKQTPLWDGLILGGRYLGDLARVVGEVEILRAESDLVVAEVKSLLGIMKRGDLLVEVPQPLEMTLPSEDPPDDLKAQVLQAEEETSSLIVQGQLLLINRGDKEGIRVGHLFRVAKDRDPVTGKTEDVLPDYKGEVKIVYVSRNASVGFVVRSKEPIRIGDVLLPAQRFAGRPAPPKREISVLEVD